MKLKQKSKWIILAVCAFILIIAVSVPVFLHISEQNRMNKYLSYDIKNVDAIGLIADSAETDNLKNTVAGFKEAVRRGADSVRIDLCFTTDGTPVAADDYADAESAIPLEDFFKAMKEEEFKEIKLYLNIVQLSKMTKLNNLAVAYDLVNRLYIVGIDKAHYGLITSNDTIIPFYLDYSPTHNSDGSDAYALLNQYGASGVVISSADASAETIASLKDFSVPFCVETDSQSEFCEAALSGAENIVTPDVALSRDILNRWIAAMQERNASSIDEYLNQLASE